MAARLVTFAGLLIAAAAAPTKPSLRKSPAAQQKLGPASHAPPRDAHAQPGKKPVTPKAPAHPGKTPSMSSLPLPSALVHPVSPGSVASAAWMGGAHASTAPLIIPFAANAGPDGFPQLPKVSQMLLTEKQEVQTFSQQTNALEADVKRAEKSREAKLTRQRNLFEQKLKKQEEMNMKIVSGNSKVSAFIEALNKTNSVLDKHNRALRANNHVMHMELSFMKDKLKTAMSFVDSSLVIADSHKKPLFLNQMSSESRQPWQGNADVDYYYEETEEPERPDYAEEADDLASYGDVKKEGDDDDSDSLGLDNPSSLLELSSQAAPAAEPSTPDLALTGSSDSLLDQIVKHVMKLKQEEARSEKSLKETFVKDYKMGSKRHAALFLQRKQLVVTQKELQKRMKDLRNTQTRLKETQHQLQQRLQRLSVFLQGLADVNKASVSQVPRLLKAIPKNV